MSAKTCLLPNNFSNVKTIISSTNCDLHRVHYCAFNFNMSAYTLYYFNGRGRAEICRMLFAAAGIQYNDKRIEFSDWTNFIKKMPSSCLPVLEIEGQSQIPQSMTIARFLAKEFGFHGKTNIDMAKVEFISDCLYDLFHDYMRMYHDRDGRLLTSIGANIRRRSTNSEMRQRYQETCRRVLPFLEWTLENDGHKYFMGDQMLMCDIMCFCALENPLNEDQSLLTKYPKLQAVRKRVETDPTIAAYLKRRNTTEF